jgi:hypothetical protein
MSPNPAADLKALAAKFQTLAIGMELVTEAQRAAAAGPEAVDETLDARASLVREGAHVIARILRLDASTAP